MDKLNRVMQNVMAALNTFGVEFDTNVFGVWFKGDKLEDLGEKGELVDFESENFQQKFKDFAEKEQYSSVSGSKWVEDGDAVVVLLKRSYQMTAEDWDDYAAFCGYDDPMAAQAACGDPTPSYLYLRVRVERGHIEQFVHKVAKYCW